MVSATRSQSAGARGARQRLQIECTRRGEEHTPSELAEVLRGHEYPPHFIDFEAAQPVIPFHTGMRPYDRVAFQWSCHTIREPGAPSKHAEWTNTDRALPNVEFARSLREAIGSAGTVYVWSAYESATLKSIRAQMDAYSLGTGDVERGSIVEWLDVMDAGKATRIIDLNRLALDYHFHPLIEGRTSIKVVLPAVLAANAAVLNRPEMQKYRSLAPDGSLQSPYASLPELTLPDETTMEAVREGTGAMRAYEEMLFGVYSRDPEYGAALRDLLLQYCELDTAAMVMIWDH